MSVAGINSKKDSKIAIRFTKNLLAVRVVPAAAGPIFHASKAEMQNNFAILVIHSATAGGLSLRKKNDEVLRQRTGTAKSLRGNNHRDRGTTKEI